MDFTLDLARCFRDFLGWWRWF